MTEETDMQRTIRHLRTLADRLERYDKMLNAEDRDLPGISLGLMLESEQLAKLSNALTKQGG